MADSASQRADLACRPRRRRPFLPTETAPPLAGLLRSPRLRDGAEPVLLPGLGNRQYPC